MTLVLLKAGQVQLVYKDRLAKELLVMAKVVVAEGGIMEVVEVEEIYWGKDVAEAEDPDTLEGANLQQIHNRGRYGELQHSKISTVVQKKDISEMVMGK